MRGSEASFTESMALRHVLHGTTRGAAAARERWLGRTAAATGGGHRLERAPSRLATWLMRRSRVWAHAMTAGRESPVRPTLRLRLTGQCGHAQQGDGK